MDCFLKGKLRDETVIAWSDDVKVVDLSLDEFVDFEDIMRRKDKIFTEYYPAIKKREEEERLERERKKKKKKKMKKEK